MKNNTHKILGVTALLLGVLLSGAGRGTAQETSFPFKNPKLPIPQRVDDLVSRMTLQEKVAQMMSGAPAIERLGVPAYEWWSEGLHGLWNSPATVFPEPVGYGRLLNMILYAMGVN